MIFCVLVELAEACLCAKFRKEAVLAYPKRVQQLVELASPSESLPKQLREVSKTPVCRMTGHQKIVQPGFWQWLTERVRVSYGDFGLLSRFPRPSPTYSKPVQPAPGHHVLAPSSCMFLRNAWAWLWQREQFKNSGSCSHGPCPLYNAHRQDVSSKGCG